MKGITSVLVSSPVTALEVGEAYVISGEASDLHAYDLETGQHLGQICLLGHRTIHGIRKGTDNIYVVFGQKGVAVVHIEAGESIRFDVLREAVEFQDWVLDVSFLRHRGSPSCLGLALAHNSLLLWNWKENTFLHHIHCAENCILYSARLLGSTWDSLVLAAGTVFNQVVLWRPTGPKDELGRCLVQSRLKGHEGVIFNLSYHEGRRLLCSVSDDRSIRLWPLDLRNTPVDPVDSAQMVLYGHSARVWDAKILDHTIVSVGEDATCCVWNESGIVIHRFTGHKGRSIWSLAVHANQKLIVTGGGDSSIRTWPLNTQQEAGITTEELRVTDHGISPGCSNHTVKPEVLTDTAGLAPRQLAVLNTGKIVVMTLNGCLLSYSLASKKWSLLSHEPDFQSYSLFSVCPNHQMTALGNIKGQVKILSLDDGETVATRSVFTGKVFSLCWVKDDNLFASGPEGIVVWLKLVTSLPSEALREVARLRLPEAHQRWLTTVAMVPDRQDNILVCGDRRGCVHLYADLTDSAQGQPSCPVHTISGVHGKVGVTQVCFHAGYVYSTGRDGTYRQYRLQGTRLHLMNTFKVYKGFHWIEGLSFTVNGDILVSGFHASSFIVWSQGSNEPLVQITCGGGHRAWGFAVCQGLCPSTGAGLGMAAGEEKSGSRAVFACVKAQRILVCTAPGERLKQHPILKESLHGRKITCITYVATVTLPEDQEYAVLATGSEDNLVNLSAVALHGNQPATIHVLHRLNVHISSVRCLATCPSSISMATGQGILLFSVGGRRAIQCWRVTIPDHCPLQDKMQAIQWLKSSCTVEHLASYGNTDDVKQRRWLKRHGRPIDPETRFMSISICRGGLMADGQPASCLLGITGSDSCIRMFGFDEGSRELNPLLSSDTSGCCLLTTYSFVHDSPRGPIPIFLTAGTDGSITLWDVGKVAVEGTREKLRRNSSTEESDIHICARLGEPDVDVAGSISTEPCHSASRVITNDGCGMRTARNCMDTVGTTQPLGEALELNSLTSVASSNSADVLSPCKAEGGDQNKVSVPKEAGLPKKVRHYKEVGHLEEAGHQEEAGQKEEEGHQEVMLQKEVGLQKEAGHQKEEGLLDEAGHQEEAEHQKEAEHQEEAEHQNEAGHIERSESPFDADHNIGQLLLTVRAHQSGVNALCVQQLYDDRYLMASGGDDNAIQLSLLSISRNEGSRQMAVDILDTHSIPSAHAAMVSGLRFLSPFTLASISIDQRLNVWDVTLPSDGAGHMQVEQVASKFINIADCAAMTNWTSRCNGQLVATCGQGLQVLHLERTEKPV